METAAARAIAIVGVGAVLPDAPNVPTFWNNVKNGRYSITPVTPERWDPALYFDPDPLAPDKTYSQIGGWVRDFPWDPIEWHLPIPPRVTDAMDISQKWAIACTREALEDFGYPKRQIDGDRTAVILGNAMAGEKHYFTALRLYFPEYEHELQQSTSFSTLPGDVRRQIETELHARIAQHFPSVTEDSMPGELANCIAGRIANIYNFHGPNFVVDAACASAMAAISSACDGLARNDFDLAITGGIDRNMGASTFIKFCKIGALSATGTRPYADGADGFVMGEGAVMFVLKRIAEAEHDQDKIYAVLRGTGASSDGKGKGITAPNPLGQKLCIERAWQNAGLSPATATLIEGHGTSTRVGDVVEVESLAEVLTNSGAAPGSVALGSVKSNLGHLKGASGAAGVLKTALALHDKVLPPSIHCESPNPGIDFAHSPLFVNTALREWRANGTPRRAGVSAFGFGGTNFHVVLEECIPGKSNGKSKHSVSMATITDGNKDGSSARGGGGNGASCKSPLRGALVVGAFNERELVARLQDVQHNAILGVTPPRTAPSKADLSAPERVAIDYADATEVADKADKALKALSAGKPAIWKALRPQGIFRGHGPAPKVAFLYTGQGSQYVNMLRLLRDTEPIVAETFAEADGVLQPLLGKPLSEFIFVDGDNEQAVAQAEQDLRQTAITQPAVLAADLALTRLLAAYGIEPDMTMGHSLGEYGALVAAGALPLEDALEAVSARGREMTRVSVVDNGKMAAVFAPIDEIERILKTVNGYVVIANINSDRQAVIGGATTAVEQAMELLEHANFHAVPLPVSHAFHTSIVAPATEPLRATLQRLHLRSPQRPVIANVNGEFYPQGPNVVPAMLDILSRQVASPVQFVKGLRTLYAAGARVFVEVGPKKALQGFAEDVLGEHEEVLSLFTNHPKIADEVAFNQALCGLYAAGLGRAHDEVKVASTAVAVSTPQPIRPKASASNAVIPTDTAAASANRYTELGRLFAQVLDRANTICGCDTRHVQDPIVITGAAIGLPGTERIFDDTNVARILRGDQLIDVIPTRFRRDMLDKNITRLVKSDNGGPTFETINQLSEVIKLAGRGGAFDLEAEFGLSADRVAALDRVTQLAIAAGIDALRDAGIPLVMRYKTTTKGTQLPDRWGLPDALRDDTGVIFGSAFPGYNSYADEMARFYNDHARREAITMLETLRARAVEANGDESILRLEIDRRIEELRKQTEEHPYIFERRFLFKTLSMGHSQFAEFIGARGPNTQINAACATTTQACTLAEDWIRAGRCRRVIVISADDVTSDPMIGWFGAGFLASGAAATDEVVEDAATPFDRRRHGLIMGMGAAAIVVESAQAARERGLTPICEQLSTVTANSAFHGSRLDVQHISGVMEKVIAEAEQRHGISRAEIAPHTVFVSHETYTPARGGSASAEVHALRQVFGDAADQIVISNTKGFTGHAMATGIEDVVAIKALETACVPPVPNFKEVDPELGTLNLSKGGIYPVEYALRLGAGFGSQISMTLMRWAKTKDNARPSPLALGYANRITDRNAWSAWLQQIAGTSTPELEVVQHTLRIRDTAGQSRKSATQNEKPALAKAAAAAASGAFATVSPVSKPEPVPASAAAITTSAARADVTPSEIKHSAAAALAVPVAPAGSSQSAPTLLPAASAPPVAPSASTDFVKNRILNLVAEKTGYPIDMLDLDLDLEADLGVDTVKQAEVFASVRESYNIPRETNLKLRDFPTLAHVIRFVYDHRPDLSPTALVPSPQLAPAASARIEVLTPAMAAPPPPPVMTPPAMTAVVQSASPSSTQQSHPDIAAKVLEIVAEKTGYPTDMLDLDLDLEADLGIDTVKQAEMFAAIRAAYHIPRDANLKLRDFPTLAHVIKFAEERSAASTTSIPANVRQKSQTVTPSPASPQPSPVSARPPLASFDAANSVPRRVPVPTLRPILDVCKTTGVTLGPGKRVLIVNDIGGTGDTLAQLLEGAGVTVVSWPALPTVEETLTRATQLVSTGPVHGVFWLPALDVEPTLTSMDLLAWHSELVVRLKSLYTTMRALHDSISPAGTFLVAATRMGGQHGYDRIGAVAPLGGAVTGFTKSYKRERPEALVKVLDFGTDLTQLEIAEKLIAETLRDPGAVEIGYQQGLRWTIGLEERPAMDGLPGLTLDESSVFVITGAAGSIVSAITADLAAASGSTFYLLDLVPEPDPHNSDLQRFVTDKEGLKRELFARIQSRGERATPALVERELAALERAQSAQTAIDAVRAAGGRAHYFSLDMRDAGSVRNVIEAIHATHGRIDVLLHAAGLERSHFLPDKDPREFDLVFDVKVDGFFNLLHAIGPMPLAATVVFSSVAGRFGNAGQTDYSAANDLLCKVTSAMRHTHPATRAIAIDWTAWASIGMATRGSIPKMMELAGIDMLPPEAGIPIIRRELTTGGTRGEIVIANRLGAMTSDFDPTGGLDTALIAKTAGVTPGPMVGEVTCASLYHGLTLKTTLDPNQQPFLRDHQIDGTPVLPGVMGIEAFAEAASLLCPGWYLAAIEDVNFLVPFKFYRNEPRVLTIQSVIHPDADDLLATCTLIGERHLAGQASPQQTRHFTGKVRLSRAAKAHPHRQVPVASTAKVGKSAIYDLYFHGPAYQVLESGWREGNCIVGEFAKLPPNHSPAERLTLAAPRLIELCFQTAGLWEMGVHDRFGLPLHIDRVELYGAVSEEHSLYAVVTPTQEASSFDAQVVDNAGNVHLSVHGYQTISLPGTLDPRKLEPLHRAMLVEQAVGA